MQFIKDLFTYFSENPVLTAVLIACFVFIGVVVAIICYLTAQAKKAEKALAEKATLSSSYETDVEHEPVDETDFPEVKSSDETIAREDTDPVIVLDKTEKEPISKPTPKKRESIVSTPTEIETKKEEKPSSRIETATPTTSAKEVKAEEKETPIDNASTNKRETSRYNGKWVICHLIVKGEETGEETYFFELHASNGEKLLSSEEYTSYNGALKGIETHKANILKNNFRIGLSKKGEYIFKLLSGKNTLLCTGENYPTKARCERAIESTKRFASTAIIDENTHDVIVELPHEQEEPTPIVDNGYLGKWIVSKTVSPDGDEVFYFELFASNGEKLLSSEEYASYVGAINGIETHKANIEKGNFRITFTKRGDYIYKLLTGNGQLLCLGEHYKTKRRCENAVESVKRFAKNATMHTSPNVIQD